MSAKGITRAAQNLLRHADYNDPLVTGSTLRAENIRIVSENYVLQTVSTNKICLPAFYNKRHILNEGLKTLSLGHYKIDHCRVGDFSWDSDEVEWDYENVENYAHLLLESSPNWDHNSSFVVSDTTNNESREEWETPDAGFAMTSIINEEDIDSNDNVDFDATTSCTSSSSPNQFINYEANSAVKVVAIMKKSQRSKLRADNKLVPNYPNCAF